ncbi:MAG: 50S ribosomal protein L24 [Candidatus Binatia bacterium]
MSGKLKIKKGDTVLVVVGRERGKSGRVMRVAPDKGQVFVERLNVVKRHQKPRGTVQGGGGIVEKEAPLGISKVMYLCGKCNKPVRLGKKRLEDGRLVRFCRSCDEQVDG